MEEKKIIEEIKNLKNEVAAIKKWIAGHPATLPPK